MKSGAFFFLFFLYKDDENGDLCRKLKEAEEDRARLHRTSSMQQAQLEKHRGLAEEANRTCDGLRQQLAAFHKVK